MHIIEGTALLKRMRRDAADEGFTLIEVVVALALFGLLAGTISLAMGSALKQTKNNQNRTVAANVAQRVIDRIHAIDFKDITLGAQPTQTFRVGGQLFSVNTSTSYVAEDGGLTGSACDGTGALSSTRVSVEVTWDGMGSARPVRNDVVRAMAVKDKDPTRGTITVKVVDRTGKALAGQVVTLSPGAKTFTTGSDGCAVFPQLVPGGYSASLNTAGYVDRTGTQAVSRAITAVANTTTKDPGFSYDQAASLTANWTLAAPNTLQQYPVLTGTGATLGSAAFSATGNQRNYQVCGSVVPCATSTGSGLQFSSLFPESTGYQPWAGACTDAKPTALQTATVLQPGGSATAALPLAPVTLTLMKKGGTSALNGGVVKITHSADSACAVVNTSLTAGSTTNVVRLSLPGGAFSFQVATGTVVTQTLVPGGAPTNITVVSS